MGPLFQPRGARLVLSSEEGQRNSWFQSFHLEFFSCIWITTALWWIRTHRIRKLMAYFFISFIVHDKCHSQFVSNVNFKNFQVWLRLKGKKLVIEKEMRKILRYSSLEWDEKQWEKQITWEDPDFSVWRGQKKDQQDREYSRVIQDIHVMFALLSKKTPAKMLLTPIENEGEPREITMNTGGLILVGNGFVYYDTRLADLKE